MGTLSIDELAEYLNRLSLEERELLYRKVRHRDLTSRLERLSERYRARLAREEASTRSVEDLLSAWAQEREDLVARDHPE